KLTRTLFLVPLVAGFSLAFVRRSRQTDDVLRGVGAAFPGFVVAFVGMSMLSSAGVISQPVAAALGQASKLMITLVLVAVGLSSDLGRVRHLGLRPLLIGLVTSVVVAVTGFWLLTGVLG
ncbi:MAG: putative sulfate exporter family transporter, partial [Bacillota bacterium]